jgi:mannose-1-phosphate guanylyltransferase
MNGDESRWGVVLAGGSGSRLSALTTDSTGTVIPKQYCSFLGGSSLLSTTIERLKVVLDPRRIVVVVSANHRRWWESELRDIAPDNIVVQPCNRGTACGLLLPLLSILYRDPDATIVVSPADHYVEDEETLTWALMESQAHVEAQSGLLVLLGIEPDRPDTGYGWITASPFSDGAFQVVTSFVEKPDAALAGELMRSGALWSSFTFVVTAKTLMAHFQRSMPWLVDRFSKRLAYVPAEHQQSALLCLYDRLPTVDFSQHVLQRAGSAVHVLPVPPCGWTDLGTPHRVSECATRSSRSHDRLGSPAVGFAVEKTPPRSDSAPARQRCPVDLAEAALRAIEAEAL